MPTITTRYQLLKLMPPLQSDPRSKTSQEAKARIITGYNAHEATRHPNKPAAKVSFVTRNGEELTIIKDATGRTLKAGTRAEIAIYEQIAEAFAKRYNVAEIIDANNAKGKHFFDADTMKTFKSKVENDVFQTPTMILFITSEVLDMNRSGPRVWKVRQFNPYTGAVWTAGGTEPHSSKAEAVKEARELTATQ